MSEPPAEPVVTPPAEEPAASVVPTEEPKAPETSETPVVTETPITPEVKEPEVDIKAIEEQVTKSVSERIVKSLLGGSEEEVTTATGEQSPWAKEGRNPRDYDEIAEWSAQLMEKKQTEAKAQEQTETTEREAAQVAAQAERATSFNKYWDTQLNELFEGGRIPPITDVKNENDPGVVARKDLFTKMIEVNEQRVKDGKEPIYSLKEIFYEHYSNEEPGMSAPVSAGRGTVPAEGEQYEYVGKQSFFDILKSAIGK